MAGHRINRINEDVLRELTSIVRTVKDPRVSSDMLSIVRVETTNDLSYSTVYVSAIEGMDKTKESVVGLDAATGYIRRELGLRLKQLRHVPSLRFVADDSIEYSAGLSKRFAEINTKDSEAESNTKDLENE